MFFKVYFDGRAQDGPIGGGWCLEYAWAREGDLPMWAPAMKNAINISTETWPAHAIVVETIACQEAMNAIVSAVDLRYVTMRPKCRGLRQGKLANSN